MSESTHTHPVNVKVKRDLADRLRQVRATLYGEDGGPELARQLAIPPRSWTNFESGVSIPGDILLHFLILTDAEPRWLLFGEGASFRLDREGPNLPAGGEDARAMPDQAESIL